MWNKQRHFGQLQSHVWIANFLGRKLKNFHTPRIFVFLRGPMIWEVMPRNVWNDIANWRTEQLISKTKSQLHALTTIKLKKKKWDLLENCQKFALKLFQNACIWQALVDQTFYGLWTNLHVLYLHVLPPNGPEPVTNVLPRFISYVHQTSEFKQFCHVGNTAQQCRLGLFQDSDFAGDLEDSKSTSGRLLCMFGSHTFVPISWMCKKQTSVSLSSTEAEIISLLTQVYAWMGFPLLIFGIWLLKCSILPLTNWRNPKEKYRETCCVTPHQTSTPNQDSNSAR